MMSPEAATADHVYRRIRHEIVEGAFLPGHVLKLGQLTEAFGTSATPVRDALNRLVGERLVNLLPGGGFQVRPLGPARLISLYAWHGALARLALGTRWSNSVKEQLGALRRDVDKSGQLASVTGAFFAILASATRNEELEAALTAASHALTRARALEHLLIPGAVDELALLMAKIEVNDITAARHAMAGYHRARIRRSRQIHKMMQA
jgi:DNA-binding GntR family transcriptional regulator